MYIFLTNYTLPGIAFKFVIQLRL